ncbi:hypothetical protein BOX15_Mlig001596g2 [Macrostomum lignano]|uniref:Uncharacterized protein n=1 Tax=Macrostomum lignano TaxID=282301 RepID=A0A267E1L5_9PLAT|nr:hypothetical protein BOX15_Mlig001596g2 [Macrostomum lignano]
MNFIVAPMILNQSAAGLVISLVTICVCCCYLTGVILQLGIESAKVHLQLADRAIVGPSISLSAALTLSLTCNSLLLCCLPVCLLLGILWRQQVVASSTTALQTDADADEADTTADDDGQGDS